MQDRLKRLLSCLSLLLATAVSTERAAINHAETLREWLQQQGGFMHPHVEIQRYDDATNSYGLFATKDIIAASSGDDKTIFLSIPRSIVFQYHDEDYLERSGDSDDDDDDDETDGVHAFDHVCATVSRLWKEVETAQRKPEGRLSSNDSFHAPYVNYLLDQPTDGLIPAAYSQAGKDMLNAIIGRELPAPYMTRNSFYDTCGPEYAHRYENIALGEHIYVLVQQRSWDELLLPVYDLMSHSNSHNMLNTEAGTVFWDDDDEDTESNGVIHVHLTRDIRAGEQLYTTYDKCTDCEGREFEYGVPEMLRDYGFVSGFPQQWYFPFQDGDDVIFVLHDDEDNSANVTTATDKEKQERKRVEWLEAPKEFSIRVLRGKLERLETLDVDKMGAGVPERELKIIQHFYTSMVEALQAAIYDAFSHTDSNVQDLQPACLVTMLGEHQCKFPDREYDPLDAQKYTQGRYGWNADPYACLETRDVEFENFVRIDEVQSEYQKIAYFLDQENLDTCFRLDGILQICDSYRPHYHELVVHYTASFFQQPKRVVFVGAGDSMLLHEILKYPSLELVVGLEIDQMVTRGAFKHFGTQPHWDNPKVEWWYGDAGKSLLVLPKHYFGSFDMVLVDLSETVTSMLVTKGMDIMTALGLLLTPDGILVKNEAYFDKLSSIFDFTLQVNFDDVPCICSQILSLGSPSRNFMLSPRFDHKVPALAAPSNIADSIRHDFKYNKDSDYRRSCVDGEATRSTSSTQSSSPGILMLVEAENVSPDVFESPEDLQKQITRALTGAGLHAIETKIGLWSDGVQMFTFLSEGYVSARCWQEASYCALDVFMWSAFEKHDEARHALLLATGGDPLDSSAYRIVTGGMFGLATWVDDDKRRGPRLPECTSREPMMGSSQINTNVLLLESLTYLDPNKSVLAVVLCGSDVDSCTSRGIVSASDSVKDVLVLQDCSLLGMPHCELEIAEAIDVAVLKNGGIGFIALDEDSPKELAQIVLKILESYSKKLAVVREGFVAAAVMSDANEQWRRQFLNRIQRDVMTYEPAFRAELLFNSTGSTTELGIASSVNPDFFDRLVKSVARIEKETSSTGEIIDIRNGLWHYKPEFVPTHFGLPSDNDPAPALKQWHSQKPLARQTVFQFEVTEAPPAPKDAEALLTNSVLAIFADATPQVYSFASSGEGYLISAQWDGGNLIFVFDGRSHVDANLFTTAMAEHVHDAFLSTLTELMPVLSPTLRDAQPRGPGRVVNYPHDIEDWPTPHWALSPSDVSAILNE